MVAELGQSPPVLGRPLLRGRLTPLLALVPLTLGFAGRAGEAGLLAGPFLPLAGVALFGLRTLLHLACSITKTALLTAESTIPQRVPRCRSSISQKE